MLPESMIYPIYMLKGYTSNARFPLTGYLRGINICTGHSEISLNFAKMGKSDAIFRGSNRPLLLVINALFL